MVTCCQREQLCMFACNFSIKIQRIKRTVDYHLLSPFVKCAPVRAIEGNGKERL